MKKLTTIFIALAFFAITNVALAAKPVVNLHSASNITQNSATLSLSYTSDSAVSAVMFNYSPDASFGSNNQMVNGTSKTVTISGLSPNTRYYYRASVTNNDGSTLDPTSGSYYFDTVSSSTTTPYTETLGEESVTSSSLTLSGRVNTYGASGTAYYKFYASNCSSLISTTSATSLTATSGSQYIRSNVSGLSANTAYCSELISTVNGATYSGGKVTVRTSSGGTSSLTCSITSFYADPASVVSGNSTILRWTTTNCTTANLNTLGGSVSVNGSQSTGALYSTTTYKLNASNSNNTDSQTISIGVLPDNGGGTTKPSCYYNSTCYWNGTTWVYYNNNDTKPQCYYAGKCYWNGSSWINNPDYTNPTPTYPSCYYSATCYWNGTSWVYTNGNTGPNLDNYTYNPHSPYTGGPNYVYKTAPPVVNTVYVDQPVQGAPINQFVTEPVTTSYVGYNTAYTGDIMSRWGNAYYDNVSTTNRTLLTGAAGYGAGFTFISLLIALIIILIIVYFVRSSQKRDIH